ncbi:ABC transporter substrate-binding protein [Clostridium coskatii]|uniref:DUF1858 domain-containing protein n=1 Tax=Clostridium coskatii TaxID=1705578 RepID=A0A162NFJ8_9CLOT|nr:ABC transporter substrate-binding protein [Clostridium coskatii]OAA92919.1 hypothetical protein WX73_00588 [Clostridium coskatii]OBR95861.1 hypothetical protein CLCOS_12940 [Clostridium coskatii]
MEKISPRISIKDLIEKYPMVIDIFRMCGFNLKNQDDLLNKFGERTMLQTVLKVRKLNIKSFIDIVESKINEKEVMSDFSIKTMAEGDNLNLLGYVPVPIKRALKENLDKLIYRYKEKKGKILKCYVPCGHSQDQRYLSMWEVKDINEFPDVLITFGFESYFNREFFYNLVEKGYFKCAWHGAHINKDFSGIECGYNEGGYTMYSVSPYILLVDKKKIGSLDVPKIWSDLFKVEYKNNIIVEGRKDFISSTILHYIYKDYGEEGIRKLASNVKDVWAPAKMARSAGTPNSDGAAIYIMPWFFAKCCSGKDDTFIVWPEDGAFIYPLYMLIKKSKWDELHEIVKLITGKEFGGECAEGCCPSLNPCVDNELPKNAKFKWIGWNYIKSNDMCKLKNYLNSIFVNSINSNTF